MTVTLDFMAGQMNEYNDALEHGLLNINEVRIIFNLPPIEGGDVNFVTTPTGIVPVSKLQEFFVKNVS